MAAFLEARRHGAKTNADRIRTMTDEELFRLLNKVYCTGTHDADFRDGFTWGLEWLQQPAEEDT